MRPIVFGIVQASVMKLSALLLLILLPVMSAQAETPEATKSSPVEIPAFDAPPVIDGALDDEVWSGATVLKDFVQTYPGDNSQPSRPTEVLIGRDADHLFVAFHAFDEPDDIRATVSRRDQIFSDDYVGIYIDTFYDHRRAYALFFNPHGIQADGFYTELTGTDTDFDLLMQSKGRITEDGYVVEVAIPFTSLRYEKSERPVWGLHLVRVIQRAEGERTSWMPIDRNQNTYLGQEGAITGFDAFQSRHPIEIIPTFSFVGSGTRKSFPLPDGSDPGRIENDSFRNLGVTAKIGITSNITLDLAANPDFADVESDAQVVTANQRFPIYFPEKRPFFLEGADVFSSPLGLVYTRTIVDPDVAAKLSGKTGRTTFGLLLASDAGPGNYSDEERANPVFALLFGKFFDKNATIGAVRLKRDVGKDSNVGILATSYDFVERHNHVFGADASIRLDATTRFNFAIAGSTTRQYFRDPDANASTYRTGNGVAFSWSYADTGRHTSLRAYGQGRSQDFRALVGFIPRTGIASNGVSFGYSATPHADGAIVGWFVSSGGSIAYDGEGRARGSGASTSMSLQLRRQTSISGFFSTQYERLLEEEFGLKRTSTRPGAFVGPDPERSSVAKSLGASFYTAPVQWFAANASYSQATGVFDYDFGAGARFPRVSPTALSDPFALRDPGPARSTYTSAGVYLQPSDRINCSFDYSYSRLRRSDTNRVVYIDHYFSTRCAVQLTNSTSVRAILDYDTLASTARGQFQFSWSPSPGTSIHAGYNDAFAYNGFSPFSGAFEPGLRRDARSVYVKVSWLVRVGF